MLPETSLAAIEDAGGVVCKHDYVPLVGGVVLCRKGDGSYLLLWSASQGQYVDAVDGLMSYEEGLRAYVIVHATLEENANAADLADLEREHEAWLHSEQAWEHPPLPPVKPALVDDPPEPQD